MGALTVTGLGVVLVGVEFRLNAIDVLADPLGWLLVALGAWMLAARGPSALALLAAPLSAAGAYLTFRTVLVDSATGRAVTVPRSDTGVTHRGGRWIRSRACCVGSLADRFYSWLSNGAVVRAA